MKKLLGAAAAVLAMALALTGCNPNAGTASNAVTFPVADVSSIQFAKNGTYNYQALVTWLADTNTYTPVAGDKITFTIKGTSDIDISEYKAFLVDASTGWNMTTGYINTGVGATAGEEVTITVNATLTADAFSAAPAACKLGLYYDLFGDEDGDDPDDASDDVSHTSTFTVTSFKVSTTATKGKKVVKEPKVIFDASTFTAPEGMEIVDVDGEKYLKMTPVNYSTSFKLDSSVNVTGYSKVEAVGYSPDADGTYQFVVQLVDWSGAEGDAVAVKFSPAKTEETTASVVVGDAAVLTHVQIFTQTMSGDWPTLTDKVVYLKSITIK